MNDRFIFYVEDSNLLTGGWGAYGLTATNTKFDNFVIEELYPPVDSGGLIASWTSGASIVKIAFDEVTYPEGSIPSPKNAPIYLTTPFKAQSGKTL